MLANADRGGGAARRAGVAVALAAALMPTATRAATPAPDEPPPTDSLEAAASTWAAPPPIDRPAEDRAAAHDWGEQWENELDSYYTAPLAPVVVGLRGVPSVGVRVDEGVAASFAFDVAASMRVALHRGYSPWSLWPELSYTLVVSNLPNHHEVGVGLGVGRVVEEVTSLRWIPRFVADVTDPTQLAAGVRNSIVGGLFDILSVELSHQWLSRAAKDSHDMRLGVGLDLLVVVTRAALGEGLEP